MDETKSGMGWIGVLFVILVVWAIFGGFGNGFGSNGWGNRQGAPVVLTEGGYYGGSGCNRVSNCEIERQGIIDSAQTRYLIEQQGAQTRTDVANGVAAITDQNNRLYIQGLNEKIFDLKLENMSLRNNDVTRSAVDALSRQMSSCCCEFNRRIDGIEAEMLTRPQLSGVAVTCSGQLVPTIAT